MNLNTTVIVLKAFNKCPKCDRKLQIQDVQIEDNHMIIGCTCKWEIVITEVNG